MATKKRTPDTNQIGLSLPVSPSIDSPPGRSSEPTKPVDSGRSSESPNPVAACEPGAFNLEDLDDYEEDETKLRLLDPPKKVTIIVEAVNDWFEISRLGHWGHTWARIVFTREELIELVSRAQAALEITK